MNQSEIIKQFEAERCKLKKFLSVYYLFIFICLLISFIIFFALRNIFIFFIAFALVFALCMVINSKKKGFARKFKIEFISKLVSEELGENAIFDINSGIPESVFMTPRFTMKPDRYYSEDLISASFDGIRYRLADCHLQRLEETVDANGNTTSTYQTFFKGRFIEISLNRNINFELRVIEKKCLYLELFGSNKLEKISTESISFNNKFDIRTSDSHKAFYILTPSLIQKMLELESMYKGTIYYCFLDDKLYIAINNNYDSFEPKINSKIDEKFIQKIYADIKIAPAIINEFNLNSDKFKE